MTFPLSPLSSTATSTSPSAPTRHDACHCRRRRECSIDLGDTSPAPPVDWSPPLFSDLPLLCSTWCRPGAMGRCALELRPAARTRPLTLVPSSATSTSAYDTLWRVKWGVRRLECLAAGDIFIWPLFPQFVDARETIGFQVPVHATPLPPFFPHFLREFRARGCTTSCLTAPTTRLGLPRLSQTDAPCRKRHCRPSLTSVFPDSRQPGK